ncbi:hypothetical protein [Metamycoplasma canadense]|uniref:Uncharacterized protein n=1 Tax=Metamycoplasma canadense TaxID=29554 RepID=A0A077L9N5_9BACT|nr:hypothetical protein [Metamycoplasma canadense]BAP39748.1 hypothetical protein MCAN360_0703 [Metamycoplasma canadense]
MNIKNYKKLFFSFDLLLNIVFFLSLFFIFVYIIWAKNYNKQFEDISLMPSTYKKYINWRYLYPVSFSLIYLSIILLQVTKFVILLRNKNGILKSLFPIFFINKINILNSDLKINKTNFIAFFVFLNISLLSILISAIFNIISDRVYWSFIVFIIYFVTIMVSYVPITIYFYNWNHNNKKNRIK